MKRTNHDPIPRESEIRLTHDKKAGRSLLEFFAFNTVVSIAVFDNFKRADTPSPPRLKPADDSSASSQEHFPIQMFHESIRQADSWSRSIAIRSI